MILNRGRVSGVVINVVFAVMFSALASLALIVVAGVALVCMAL